MRSTSTGTSPRKSRTSSAGRGCSKIAGTGAPRRLHNRCSAALPAGSIPLRQKARPMRATPAPGAPAGHRPWRTTPGPGSKGHFVRTSPPIACQSSGQREAQPRGQREPGAGDTASGCGSGETPLPGKRQIWERPAAPRTEATAHRERVLPLYGR